MACNIIRLPRRCVATKLDECYWRHLTTSRTIILMAGTLSGDGGANRNSKQQKGR
jgi:hypothetical protein